MADSSDSVSVDMESTPLAGKEHIVKTCFGSVSVALFGDRDKPALITYPDLALNYMSCFQGLFDRPEAFSLLLHNFCIYHISPPGHELGAAIAEPDEPLLSVDDLADQIAEVLDYFGLGSVMCLGVTAGSYILTLFAIKYSERVMGLILVSPLCKSPSWTEWLYNKVMSNLLYMCGMCGVVKEILLMRYFSKEVRGGVDVPESDLVQSCRRLLSERQSPNVMRFLEAINGRPDITNGLRRLQCRSLIFVGENSPFHSEALHMTSKLDRRFSALVEVIPISHLMILRTLCQNKTNVGASLRVDGYRRTSGCHVDPIGILPHGVWLLQAISIQHKPPKPVEPNEHIPRALLTGKHGGKAETYQDKNPSRSMSLHIVHTGFLCWPSCNQACR